MRFVDWLSIAGALLVMAAALALPAVTVVFSRRERSGLATGRVGRQSLQLSALAIALLAPPAASVLTPDWSPLRMFVLAAGPWALVGWSVVFRARYRQGSTGLASAASALPAAISAPFLGAALFVLRACVGSW